MADVQLSTYQKNIIDTFKSTKDNLFIEALAGCVDCDTEYFNGTEWVRIADYKQGDKVLQYDIDTHEASLVHPLQYYIINILVNNCGILKIHRGMLIKFYVMTIIS